MAAINYFRVFQQGTVAADRWQFGIAFDPNDPFNVSAGVPSAFGVSVADLARAMWVTLAPYTSAMVTFTGVKIIGYGADGKAAASGEFVPTAGSVAGSAATNHPPQCAVVASLLSDDASRSGRGRIYLPLVSPTVATATGTFPTADCTAIANAVKTFCNGVEALATWPTTGSDTIVASTLPGKTFVVVKRIRVGNVFDTQRRRRNKIVETSSTVTL